MSKVIQLRHIPDELHRKLKARAAMEGLSLSDYLLQEVERLGRTPHTQRSTAASITARTCEAAYLPCPSCTRRAPKTLIVIDASALIEVLLNRPASAKVTERLFGRSDTLHAPHLLDLEVAQVLRGYTWSGEMSVERSEQALDELTDLPLESLPA